MSVEHVCRRNRDCTCDASALDPADDCPVHAGGERPPRCEVCGKFLAWPDTSSLFKPGGTPDSVLKNPPADCESCREVRAADRAAFGTDSFVTCLKCGRRAGPAPLADVIKAWPPITSDPVGYAAFSESLRADILTAIAGNYTVAPPPGGPESYSIDGVRAAYQIWQERQRVHIAAAHQRILAALVRNGLTSSGESRRLSTSQAADTPPGTLGDYDVSTLHGLASKAAATTADESGAPVPPARVLVGGYLVSLFGHAEDAFRIRVGRRVEALPRFNTLQRVPPGVYEVVRHFRTGGVAYVAVRATKPRVPGGRIDPHVHPRVPVNDVNPVPCWDVFPPEVYGERLAAILPGLAARGFPAREMMLLADEWGENGFTFNRAGQSPELTATGEEFAAAWVEFLSEVVEAGNINPVQFSASYAANHANHYPQG